MNDNESYFDKKLYGAGDGLGITIPMDTVRKLKLKKGDIVEIRIKKGSKK